LSRGLNVIEGRDAVEVLPPGLDKLRACRRIAGLTGSEFIVYGGDDASDTRLIADLHSRRDGLGVFVNSPLHRSTPPACDIHVDSPEQWVLILEAIESLRQESHSTRAMRLRI
jgi:trehalose-6-phosphatase